MSRKFSFNGKTYNSIMSIAREIGINRIYRKDFAKYGIEEIVCETNVTPVGQIQVGETDDVHRTTNCHDETVQFHDPTTRYELVGQYGKKFNKRAFVTHIKRLDIDVKYLVSYGGVVAKIENNKAEVYGTYSSETLAHIKEFLQQNGFKADSCTQIREDYM